MRSPANGRVALAALALSLAWAANGQDPSGLTLVPHPDLAQEPAEVRDALQPALTRFQDERSRLTGSRLGVAYGSMALNYHAFGFLDAAQASYRNAVALDSGNVRWPYLLGALLLDQDQAEEALPVLEAALKLDPIYAPAYSRRGRALLALDRPAEAMKDFETVLKARPRDAFALAGAGEAALAQERPAEAAAFFRRALTADPTADALRARLAEALAAAGDDAAAAAERAKAGDRAPELEDPLFSFMSAHRHGQQPYLAQARTAAEAGRWGEAAGLLEIAVSIAPDSAQALTALGDARARSGDLEGAAAALREARELAPEEFLPNYLLGTVMERAGRDLDAEQAYRRALEIDPAKVEPRVLLGNALMRRREYSEASQHYTAAAKTLPQDTEVLTLLGLSLYAAGDCPRAVTSMALAVRSAPEEATVAEALARIFATCPMEDETNRQIALGVAERLYEEDPTQWHAETLAMAAAANGFFEDAVDFQTQAIFEAVKAEADEPRLATLRANLERYQSGQPAERAWPEDSELFSPSRLRGPAQSKGAG